MAYTTAEGRRQLLEALAEAIDRLGLVVARLGAAYEQLDEAAGDRLEEALFRPAQGAYGRAKRAYSEFAERHGMPGRTFEAGPAGPPSQGPRAFVERAGEAAFEASAVIAGLQDSMLPVEVGDAEIRSSLAEIRKLIDDLPSRGRELLRTVGR
jgi:hypothetical protein